MRGARQMLEEIAQRLLAEGIRERIVFRRVQTLHRMIDRPHPGRGPQPGRCIDRHRWVENDGAWRHLWRPEALFDAAHGIGNADAAGKFAGRQRGGDGDVWYWLPLILRVKAQAMRTSH